MTPSNAPPWSRTALTPLSFLARSRRVHRDRVAVITDRYTRTFSELGGRADQLASALDARGVVPGERIAVLAPNVEVLLEAHFGVTGAGAALVALNTRLASDELGYIIRHAGVRTMVVDYELQVLGDAAIAASGEDVTAIVAGGANDEYENLLEAAPECPTTMVEEYDLLAVNYTSGTTGRPKGVQYHHRGAYLQALAMTHHLDLEASSVMLWTLPMFHCNGWCMPWAGVAVGARQVMLRRPEPAAIWRAIREHGVTHLNAAPTVLTSLAAAPEASGGVGEGSRVRVGTGGAPPSPTLLRRLDELGFDVVHLYGLTETFGPVAVCDPHPEWGLLDEGARAQLLARQGVGNIVSDLLRVVDEAGADVPTDGATLGEIVIRGNNVMLGYLDDPEATAAACPDGWFRTGDLGVMHTDGYVELKDRAKDIVISGGENISSVEVEHVLVSHPAVLEAAVVASPDERWGEVPVAFVTLRSGQHADPDELCAHVRERLAGFKVPKRIVFGDLPKTTTGKVQKYELRERLLEQRDVAAEPST
jgi:fatty-acyl-CoA synthase